MTYIKICPLCRKLLYTSVDGIYNCKNCGWSCNLDE